VNAEVTALDQAGQNVRLTTADGSSFEAAQVMLTTGASVALASAAGLTTRPATEPRMKEAIVVDAEGRTSVPTVWAAGTAAGVSVHVIVTAGDGARVALNIISSRGGQRHVDHDVLGAAVAAH
jgi:thioredoxin reductase